MGLTVHHLGHSQSDRIVWLCEELGIEYTLQKHDRSPVLSPPSIIALHPLGAAPIITDTDSSGNEITLAESAACLEWIVNKHGNGRFILTKDDPAYADFLYWYHFANGTLQPGVSRVMALRFAGVGADNNSTARMDSKVSQSLQHLDRRLGTPGVEWLAGKEFTAADIMTVWTVTGMREFYQYSLEGYENLLAYLQRVIKREGFRRARQKGDPDVDVEKLVLAQPPQVFKGLREMQERSRAKA